MHAVIRGILSPTNNEKSSDPQQSPSERYIVVKGRRASRDEVPDFRNEVTPSKTSIVSIACRLERVRARAPPFGE